MGRRAQRAEEAAHRADRQFIAYVRTASVERLAAMQLAYVNAKTWKRVVIARALARHWSATR